MATPRIDLSKRGESMQFGAVRLSGQTACPFVLGVDGWWVDITGGGRVLKYRLASGADIVYPGASAAYAPVRVVDVSVFSLTDYDYAAGVLTAKVNGALGTVDGQTLAVGDRVLRVLGASADGIYTVTSLGGASAKAVITRAADMSVTAEFGGGALVAARDGTAYGKTLWVLTLPSPFAMDSQTPVFSELVSGASVKRALATAGAANGVGGNALSAGAMRFYAMTGRNGAGACTLTGAKVGDTVVGVADLAGGSVSAAASFEGTVSVQDQLQQSSASNLSATKFHVLLVAKS